MHRRGATYGGKFIIEFDCRQPTKALAFTIHRHLALRNTISASPTEAAADCHCYAPLAKLNSPFDRRCCCRAARAVYLPLLPVEPHFFFIPNSLSSLTFSPFALSIATAVSDSVCLVFSPFRVDLFKSVPFFFIASDFCT